MQEQIDVLNELIRVKDVNFNNALNQLQIDNIMLRKKVAKLEEQLAENTTEMSEYGVGVLEEVS
tara:strand:- start:3120 stop:3311 length:192 start_codon:yes stop_codon:yes gene_type:complete